MASIQGIYVALFGRPADPGGLAFWTALTNEGLDLSTLVGTLTAEPEATARFEGLTNAQIVNSIFQSLFNRDADPIGLEFFVAGLNDGGLTPETIAISVLDGAQGSDRTIINNKIAAADAWTSALDTPAKISAYSGEDAAAVGRAFLTPVTADAATVPSAEAAQQAINLLPPAANTFTLTTGIDSGPDFTGTEAADIFIATGATLNGVDVLVGGSSPASDGSTDDILRVTGLADTLYLGFTLNGIEQLEVIGPSTTPTSYFDLTFASGLEKIIVKDLAGTDTGFTGIPTIVAAEAIDIAGGTIGFRYNDGVLGGSADAVSMTLQNSNIDVLAFGKDLTFTDFTLDGVETLNLTTSGAASTIGTLQGDYDTVNILGDQSLTITSVLNGSGTKIDAFLMTGGAINVTTSGGNDTVAGANVSGTSDTINTSSGDDKVIGSKGADTITLGTGSDTVGYTDVAQSSGAEIDTITDFQSGIDTFDIIEFGEPIGFAGNHADFTATQNAVGAGGVIQAVFQIDTNTFWVDVNNDGLLNASDLQVKLTGVTGMVRQDITGDFL